VIGLRTTEITVTGRHRTALDQIVAALGARHGDPILGVDIEAAKDRLEALPSVHSAAIERRLPGSLHLAVSERQPSALWQIGGQYVLVDRDGHQIPGSIEGYEGLPLVVGEGAPQRAEELFDMLAAEPDLAARVKAAARIGNRRWTLTLDSIDGGLVVHLPEIEPERAWAHLAELERKGGLTRKGLSVIDLRIPDRLVLRADRDAPQSAERAPPGAAAPAAADLRGED
jgi:cell division protein FtsQ